MNDGDNHKTQPDIYRALCELMLPVTDQDCRTTVNELLERMQVNGIAISAEVEYDEGDLLRASVGDTALLCQPPQAQSSIESNKTHLVVVPLPVTSAQPATLRFATNYLLEPHAIQCIAGQLANALDRAILQEQAEELYEQADQRIRQVSTIYEIGRAIDSVELNRLLHIITEKAALVMDAQACSLMRLNTDSNALTIAASYGLSDDVVAMTEREMGEGIAGRVAKTAEPMLITEADVDPRLEGLELSTDIGSSMIVPMKDEKSRVTGVLSIRRRSPSPLFTEEDLKLFSVFASQAGLAIANKQLYDDLRRRVRELSTLSDLTQAVISHLDLNNLLENVADNIVDVVKFSRCCIYLHDRHTRRFIPRILRGYKNENIGANPVRLGEGVVGLVAKKRIPIVETDARNALQPVRGFARALGVNSFVAVPIISRGQAIGVAVADNKLSGRVLRMQAVDLLMTFVNQAGIAIENAQLYEDREQRYQEMNRLASQTDNILRSLAVGVIVINAQETIVRVNHSAEDMWGIPEDQVKGLTYTRLLSEFGLPQTEVDILTAQITRVTQTGTLFQGYKIAMHPHLQGEMFVNVVISPLIDRQGDRQGIILILEDVTKETRLEAEMSRIRRLADIGQLAAKMAHEVRNPLSSIKGAAQFMRREYEDKDSLREFLDIIIDEVNGLSRITTDLLDFARPMQLDLSWTNINNLVERSIHLFSNQLKDAGVCHILQTEPEIPNILADQKQVEQVVRNIVLNALQAMPDGGTITVATRFDTSKQSVVLSVSDTGVGIPPEKQEFIFQPFFTTKTKGTGLGLPIVRRIVENHGGRMEVESNINEGTNFTIILPVKPAVSELAESIRILPTESIGSPLPDIE